MVWSFERREMVAGISIRRFDLRSKDSRLERERMAEGMMTSSLLERLRWTSLCERFEKAESSVLIRLDDRSMEENDMRRFTMTLGMFLISRLESVTVIEPCSKALATACDTACVLSTSLAVLAVLSVSPADGDDEEDEEEEDEEDEEEGGV